MSRLQEVADSHSQVKVRWPETEGRDQMKTRIAALTVLVLAAGAGAGRSSVGMGGEDAETQAARSVIFLDNLSGIVNGSSSYDPKTRTCGNGKYTVFTELGEAAGALPDSGTLYIRAGTYSRPLTGEFHLDTRGTGAKRYQEGALNMTANGTAENRTRVAAYNGDPVVIQAKPGVSNYNSDPADTNFGKSAFYYGRAAITVFANYVDVVGLKTFGQICVPAHDVLVEGCDLGGGGGRVPQGQVVYLGGYNNVIRNNRIHHSCWGESTQNGAALMGYNFSCIVENNEFYDNYGADIRLKDAGGQQGRTTIVRNNFFRPTSINPKGNHGVEGLSQDGQIDRILIHNNIFFRKKIGIQWDGPAMKGTLAYNNTFVDCDMDISQWFKGVRVALANNLYFHRDRGAQFYHLVQHDEPQFRNLQSDHNLFFAAEGGTYWYNLYRRRASNLGDWRGYSGKDKSSVWKDPQFVNPMGSRPEDFRRKGDPKEIKDVAGSEHGPVCGAYVTGDELVGPIPAAVAK